MAILPFASRSFLATSSRARSPRWEPRSRGFVPGSGSPFIPGATAGVASPVAKGAGNLCRNVFFMGSASRFPHMQGGFADYVLVDESQCYPVSPDLPFTTAAFAEPLAVALHAVERAGPMLGRSVLITGAGPIGLLVLLAARRAGCRNDLHH